MNKYPAIGIDIDGVITSYPDFFSRLSHVWPGDVYIITFRFNKKSSAETCDKLNIRYTDIFLANNRDDKCRIIKDNDIIAFWDDMPEAILSCDKNVATFLVRDDYNFDFNNQQFLFTQSTGRHQLQYEEENFLKYMIDLCINGNLSFNTSEQTLFKKLGTILKRITGL